MNPMTLRFTARTWVSAAAVATLVAATGGAAAQSNQATTPARSASAPATSQNTLQRADRDFLEKAAHSGHAEVESSQLALQKATHPEVKAFAEHMVKDHTQANQELAALAQSRGVKVPDGPSLVQKGKLKLLSTADGEDFDRRYAQSMGVEAHRETIELFEKAANHSTDAEIKAFATKTLPKLREHLQMAEKLPQAQAAKR